MAAHLVRDRARVRVRVSVRVRVRVGLGLVLHAAHKVDAVAYARVVLELLHLHSE